MNTKLITTALFAAIALPVFAQTSPAPTTPASIPVVQVQQDNKQIHQDNKDIHHDKKDVAADKKDIAKDKSALKDERKERDAAQRAENRDVKKGDTVAAQKMEKKREHEQHDVNKDKHDLASDRHDLGKDQKDLHQDQKQKKADVAKRNDDASKIK